MSKMMDNFVPCTVDETSWAYNQLLCTFLPQGESDEGPVIRAAGNEASSPLLAILQRSMALSQKDRSAFVLDFVYGEDMAMQMWDTPLLRAIACKNVQNIRLLLEHGANPNGVDRDSQAFYARRFRRLKSTRVDPQDRIVSISQNEVGEPSTQLLPLSEDELATRACTISSFWTFPDTLPLDFSTNGDLLHSLLMAARTTTEILDVILQSDADASAWRLTEFENLLGEDLLKPSSLCVSTPLHAAIDADNTAVLEALLEHGFNPNARPLIAACQALTPVQHAMVQDKPELFHRVVSHPLTDTGIVTPVFDVHILHFAVAQLDIKLFDIIGVPLSAAKSTALGHTLLHIACLPLDEFQVQMFAPKVRESVHDVRSLTIIQQNWPAAIYNMAVPRAGQADSPIGDGPGDPVTISYERTYLPLEERFEGSGTDRVLAMPSTDDISRQLPVIQHLVTELGSAELPKVDIYGNTALHYLASSRMVNDDAVGWLRKQERGDETWRTAVNRWGWTPSDLWKDNVTTIEPAQERLRDASARGRAARRGRSGTLSRGRR